MENISIIRGDTINLKFVRKDNSGQSILVQPSNIYFTIKENTITKTTIIQKTLNDMTFNSSNGEYTFQILPNDTKGLYYGCYKYDLEVVDTNYTQTISIGNFIINEEVTFKDNEV